MIAPIISVALGSRRPRAALRYAALALAILLFLLSIRRSDAAKPFSKIVAITSGASRWK